MPCPGPRFGHWDFGTVDGVSYSYARDLALAGTTWLEAATYYDVAGVIITGAAHDNTTFTTNSLMADFVIAKDESSRALHARHASGLQQLVARRLPPRDAWPGAFRGGAPTGSLN